MTSTPNPFEPIIVEGQKPSELSWPNDVASIRALQFAIVALTGGPLVFGLYIVFFVPFAQGAAVPAFTVEGAIRNITMTTLLGVVICFVAIGLSYFLAVIVSALMSPKQSYPSPITDKQKLKIFSAFQAQLILGCAALEGAAFVNLVFYFVSRSPIALVAAALPILLLLSRFPRVAQVKRWMSQRIS